MDGVEDKATPAAFGEVTSPDRISTRRLEIREAETADARASTALSRAFSKIYMVGAEDSNLRPSASKAGSQQPLYFVEVC